MSMARKIGFGSVLAFLAGLAIAKVDINSASVEELQTLSGIGAGKAQAIVDYREANGAFASVDELVNVKGIGEKTLANIREELSVAGNATNKPSGKAKSDRDATTAESSTNGKGERTAEVKGDKSGKDEAPEGVKPDKGAKPAKAGGKAGGKEAGKKS